MTTTIYGDQLDPDTGETTGEKIFFEDVCKTVGPSDEDCDYWNPMVAFEYNQTILDQAAAAGLVLTYVDALKATTPLEAVLGQPQYDPQTGMISSAKAMLVGWSLDPNRAKTEDDALVRARRARALHGGMLTCSPADPQAFEQGALEYCRFGDGQKLQNVELHCIMQRSINDEVRGLAPASPRARDSCEHTRLAVLVRSCFFGLVLLRQRRTTCAPSACSLGASSEVRTASPGPSLFRQKSTSIAWGQLPFEIISRTPSPLRLPVPCVLRVV